MKIWIIGLLLLVPTLAQATPLDFEFTDRGGFFSQDVSGMFGYDWHPDTPFAVGHFTAMLQDSVLYSGPALFLWAAPINIESGLWVLAKSSAVELWLLAEWSPACNTDNCPTFPSSYVSGKLDFGDILDGFDGPRHVNEVRVDVKPILNPEPSTWILLGTGLAAVIWISRRRARA